MIVAGRAGIGQLIAGACFLVLAGLRAADGAWGWATGFAVLAGAQLWLSWKDPSARPRVRRGVRSPLSGEQRQHGVRSWRAIAGSCCLVAVGLLFLEPALGLVAAAAGVFSLYRMRQFRGRPVAESPTSDDNAKARVE